MVTTIRAAQLRRAWVIAGVSAAALAAGLVAGDGWRSVLAGWLQLL